MWNDVQEVAPPTSEHSHDVEAPRLEDFEVSARRTPGRNQPVTATRFVKDRPLPRFLHRRIVVRSALMVSLHTDNDNSRHTVPNSLQ